MIKNFSDGEQGLRAVVICDECKVVSLKITEKNFAKYENNWLTGITYDVCPVCRRKPLSEELRRRIAGERRLIKSYKLKRAAL